MVVMPHVGNKRETAVEMPLGIEAPVPVDVFVTDLEEIERRGHVIGTAVEAALHEG